MMFTPNPLLPVSKFQVDPGKCIGCGKCVKDCPAGILSLHQRIASMEPEKDSECILCQHCLAVCPTAAVSVDGKYPADSTELAGRQEIDPDALDLHMRARRSKRHFGKGVVSRDLVNSLLETAASAPTGVNIRHRRFTLVHSPEIMAEFRERVVRDLVDNRSSVPAGMLWMADLAEQWLNNGVDHIFRKAPHLLVITAGPDGACKIPDCLIAMSYFELIAQARGVATVWCGMVEAVLRYRPAVREWLGIPSDHEIGYVMLFGPAGVSYARTTQHKPESVVVVDRLMGQG